MKTRSFASSLHLVMGRLVMMFQPHRRLVKTSVNRALEYRKQHAPHGANHPLPESAVVRGQRQVNTMRPRQNGRHFADDTFKWIFLNENAWIQLKISLTLVHKGPINNIPALVQVMAWRRPGDKPLSEPMLVSLLTHICVTRPQWVKHPFNITTASFPDDVKCYDQVDGNCDQINFEHWPNWSRCQTGQVEDVPSEIWSESDNW